MAISQREAKLKLISIETIFYQYNRYIKLCFWAILLATMNPF